MKKLSRSLLMSGLGIAAVIAATAGATPALAAGSSTAHSAAAIQSQSSYENEVASFLSSHPQPANVGLDASVSAQNEHWAQEVAFWKSVPWEAVVGQWGCTLKSVTVERDAQPADNGVVGAGYSGLMNCGANASTTVLKDALTVATKTAQLSTRAPSASSFAQAALSPVGPNAYVNEGCAVGGSTQDCLYADFSAAMNEATVQWLENSTITGRARLGYVGSGCSDGTQLAISPLGMGGQYATWYAAHSVSMDTTWVSSFVLESGTYSRFCQTF